MQPGVAIWGAGELRRRQTSAGADSGTASVHGDRSGVARHPDPAGASAREVIEEFRWYTQRLFDVVANALMTLGERRGLFLGRAREFDPDWAECGPKNRQVQMSPIAQSSGGVLSPDGTNREIPKTRWRFTRCVGE